MTKEDLLQKLTEIEWDDFECKRAQDKLPDDVWSTVSAFSNTSGGWIIFGVKQQGKLFEINGVNNGEKTESDFLNTLRNGQKFNMRLTARGQKYYFDGKLVLAFFVPSSIVKPIYVGSPINTYIRTGSGDRRATETEVMAMMRDQAFGSKSEQVVEGTSINDLNKSSLETYRNHIRNDNPSFPYKDLPDDQFCDKVGISKDGQLTIGGILMLGQRDVVQSELRTQIHSIPRNPNLIKFFRYAKLGENAGYGIDKMLVWEKLTKGRVEFASDLVCSTITYWFGEQAGGQGSGQAGDQPKEQARVQAGVQAKEQVQRLVNVIREDAYTVSDLLRLLHLTGRRNFVENYLKPAIEEGYVLRAYPDKPKHPNQRYYLSEKGLKLVK